MSLASPVLAVSLGLVIAIVAVVLAAVLAIVLAFALRDRRRSAAGRRVAAFMSEASQEPILAGVPTPSSGGTGLTERNPQQNRVQRFLAPEIAITNLEVTGTRIILLTLIGSILLGIVSMELLGSPWGLFVGLLGPYATRWYIKRRVADTRFKFGDQLGDNLDVVASGLRAGHSIVGALAVATDAADEPSRTEFGRALSDEQLGLPLDAALLVTADRMHNTDLEQVAFVARLQREAGTNAAEVIDQVSENIRNRNELHRLIRALTAQGRMARWIVTMLPIGLFIAMYFLNKAYLEPLWTTDLGKFALGLSVVMVTAGSFMIKKIVEIEV